MIVKRIAAGVMAAAVALTLTGCNYMNDNISTLVRPPRLSDEQQLIYDALAASVRQGDTISLQSPQTGSYGSAVVTYNIDDEPSLEALAFYESTVQSTLGETGLRVCLLDQIDGQWRAVWDVPGAGKQIDKVLFFTDSQTNEIYTILGFLAEDQGQNTYYIYHYENSIFNRVDTGSYKMMDVYDITGDGQDDFITIGYKEQKSAQPSLDEGALETNAAINSVKDGKFYQWGETLMSNKAIAYNNVRKDQSSFGRPALILDEQVSKTTYATEILIFDGSSLKNLTVGVGNQLFDKTLRTQIPISYDIDGDGVVEIPHTELFPGYQQDSTNPVYFSTWYKLKGNELVDGIPAYVNYSQGFGLILPQQWQGRVTAKSILQNDEIEFYVCHPKEGAPGEIRLEDDSEKLLSLRVDTLNNAGRYPYGYFEVATIGQVVYLAQVYSCSDPDLNITEQQVKQQFVEMYTTTE